MNNKKTFRFYTALWVAKGVSFILKLTGRNATSLPGKIAIKICPDFLGRLEKPKTIIGVTGTNGKTTVCNIINDILTANKFDFINNKYGSNIDRGVATTLIQGSTILGKAKKDLAILEIDERSTRKIFPYITPTYLVCTNIFRDSLMRHAHTEYISEILSKYIPKETIMIENADDLISSQIAENNKKIYFSIDRLPTDSDHCENITRDIRVCPKCYTNLEYEYVRYHHIGKAHCPNCDFKTPEADYVLNNLDLPNKKMTIKSKNNEETYDLISDNIINIYNTLAAIIALKQLNLTYEQINTPLKSGAFIYKFISIKISLKFFNSSFVKVRPLPIFSCSGAQSRKSNLGFAPFHETILSSFVQPLLLSDTVPICSFISNFNSAIISPPI